MEHGETGDDEALRRSNRIRSAIRNVAGANNFLVERGASSYQEILAGIKKAQEELASCRAEILDAEGEIARLKKRFVWIYEYGDVARQLDQIKLFPEKFYQAHKADIDRYRYAVGELKATGFAEPENVAGCSGQLEERIKQLRDRIEEQGKRLDPLCHKLRLWCSCKGYVRDLLGLPEPPGLPKFPETHMEKIELNVSEKKTPAESPLQKKLREIREKKGWERRDRRQADNLEHREEPDQGR